MKSNNPKEGRKELDNLLIDAKRLIGLLNGPEMGKAMEEIEIEVVEYTGEIVVFVNLQKSPLV
jgi:hypothetical protein